MSDINTIVFDQKTIDELNPYDPIEDGELTAQISAESAKFPIYINITNTKDNYAQAYKTPQTTKSITLKQVKDLLDITNTFEYFPAEQEDFENTESQNYTAPMLISPEIFNNRVRTMINISQDSATHDSAGLMSPEDKIKLDTFNLINGASKGSLRNTFSNPQTSTYLLGQYAFAQGVNSQASGNGAVAEGNGTKASGNFSYTQGELTEAQAHVSQANGLGTIATSEGQAVFGTYDKEDTQGSKNTKGNYAFIVGNGRDDDHRSNAAALTWDGNLELAGEPTEDNHAATKGYVDTEINEVKESLLDLGKDKIVNMIYPIGSVYISINSINPNTLFGGQWEQIKKKFLLATDEEENEEEVSFDYPAGETGGEEKVLLSAEESGLPNHGHELVPPITKSTSVASDGMSANSSISGYFDIRGWGDGYVIEGSKYGVINANNWVQKPKGNNNIPTSGSVNKAGAQRVILSANISHTHSITIPALETSGGQVSQSIAQPAIAAHNNMPPYMAVYMWKRIA